MCHPDNYPVIAIPPDGFLNGRRGYGNAVRFAIEAARSQGDDLVIADSDGYHPPEEIEKLAKIPVEPGSALVKPFRIGIGIQSKSYSLLYSSVKGKRIRDATGGLYLMTSEFMATLPLLESEDMTINVEILNHAVATGARIVQYGYTPGKNDATQSKRTEHYQLKLLKAML